MQVLAKSGVIPQDKIRSDAEQLVALVESTHPAFAIGNVPKGYKVAKAAFISKASYDMTNGDFSWLVRAYLSSLRDGHTSVNSDFYGQGLDVSWYARGSKLYLLDGNGKFTDKEVTEINGVWTGQVFGTISKYFTAENDAARNRNDAMLSVFKDVLIRTGIKCEADRVTLTVQDGENILKQEVEFSIIDANPYYRSSTVVSIKSIGDALYVDFNSCTTGKELDETVKILQEAVETGAGKIIIDVRDNPGGDSLACQKLLEAIGMSIPEYGVYIRHSALVNAAGVYSDASGFYEAPPRVDVAKPNPMLKLCVLTNQNTYSSATMLGVWVQDGKLGTVIGQPSANSPTFFGDNLSFQLDNSELEVNISYKKFIRPDTKADQETLQPDVIVPLGGDIMQSALDFIGNQCVHRFSEAAKKTAF